MMKNLMYWFCPWLEVNRLRREVEELEILLGHARIALHNNIASIVLAAGGDVLVPATIIDFVQRNHSLALDYSPDEGGVRVTVGFEEAASAPGDSSAPAANEDNQTPNQGDQQ